MKNLGKDIASMLAAIWIGLILGVSFFAAPIKFAVKDHVAFEDLLRVGQVTFKGFTYVEVLAFVFLMLGLIKHLNSRLLSVLGVLFLALLIQKFAVLPQLEEILNQVLKGEPKKDHSLHYVYGALDLIKISVLIFISLTLKKAKDVPDR